MAEIGIRKWDMMDAVRWLEGQGRMMLRFIYIKQANRKISKGGLYRGELG
jgi:hypothetical protein